MKKINQSQQKLVNYLDEFIDSDYFQEIIIKLRKELGIPKNGLKEKIDYKNLYNYAFFIPKALKPNNSNKTNILKSINVGLKDARKKFPLKDMSISIFFQLYLFYNKKFYNTPKIIPNEVDLCQVVDMLEFAEEYSYPILEENGVQFLKNYFNDNPVILKIHPNMTQRDLVGYIKDHWPIINAYQDRYKNTKLKLGKIRTKNPSIKTRNDYIYKNRNKTRSEISSLVSLNFPQELSNSIDAGSVGKIISIERKRRKEV
jgi:hypothetical protein